MTHPLRHLLLLSALAAMLSACGSAPKRSDAPTARIDAELARSATAARTAFDGGLYPQAARLYRLALVRARYIDDAEQVAAQSFNLALTLEAQKQYAAATTAVRESRAAMRSTGAPLADALLVDARLAYEAGNLDESVGLLDALLHDPASKPAAAHLFEAHRLRGLIACDRHDADAAEGALAEAQAADATRHAYDLVARIAVLRGDFAAAADAFDRHAAAMQSAGRYSAMSDALSAAADAYQKEGHPDRAFDRAYRAARSQLAQGDMAAAQSTASLADKLAHELSSAEDLALITALRAEMSHSPALK
ncbi:MAG: hypothetical protein GC162_11525 [Planctomycetes bacterium]|nr:hypothetical protein [Planctomycetota bacterium]